MSSKDMDFLVRSINEQSKGAYKVVSSGKHRKIIHATGAKKGHRVVDANGPVIISGTPGDFRFRDMHVKRLMGVDVLKYDPWNPPQGRQDNNGGPPPEPFEARKARSEAVASSHRRLNEESAKLRERLEPLIVRIGGSWSKYGFKSEFADTMFKWCQDHQVDGWPEVWSDATGARNAVTQLSKGNSIAVKYIPAITAFLDDIEGSYTPREHYMQLVRVAKGLGYKIGDSDGIAATKKTIVAPDENDRVVPLAAVDLARPPISPFEFINLAQLHERSGLKWSMGLTIDEYAELHRATGFLEAVIMRDYGEKGQKALSTFSEFLIKMGEARFYSMAGRDETKE